MQKSKKKVTHRQKTLKPKNRKIQKSKIYQITYNLALFGY